MAHSPAPWHLEIDKPSEGETHENGDIRRRYFWVWNADKTGIVTSDPDTHKTREADFRLIAAAPELLAACKEALGNNEDPITSAILRAAIAKAEGQS